MALPPLPQGAVFIEDNELPPLPAGAKFVSSDLSVPTIMSEEEQKAAEKKYRDYESSFGHRAGQFAEEGLKMLEGVPMLGPEVNIGEKAIPYLVNKVPALEKSLSAVASKFPDIEKVTSHPLYKKATEVVEPIVEKVSDVASNVGQKIVDAPAKAMSYMSNIPTKDIKDIYQMFKESNPEIVKAFREYQKKDLDPLVDSIANYNYAMTLGMPPKVARMATHYRQDLESGAYMLKNLWENQNPLKIDPVEFAKMRRELLAKLPSNEMARAEILGMKTGDILPTGKRAISRMLTQVAGLGGIPSALLHSAFGGLGALPLIFKSPALVADVAAKSGQARKYIPTILKGAKDIPMPALVNGLNYVNSEADKEN